MRPSFDDHDHDSGLVHDVHEFVHDYHGLIHDDDDDDHHEWRKHEHAEYVNERYSLRSHDDRGDRRRIRAAHESGTSEGTCETGEGCACGERRHANQRS